VARVIVLAAGQFDVEQQTGDIDKTQDLDNLGGIPVTATFSPGAIVGTTNPDPKAIYITQSYGIAWYDNPADDSDLLSHTVWDTFTYSVYEFGPPSLADGSLDGVCTPHGNDFG
jgi:hypothetical protein